MKTVQFKNWMLLSNILRLNHKYFPQICSFYKHIVVQGSFALRHFIILSQKYTSSLSSTLWRYLHQIMSFRTAVLECVLEHNNDKQYIAGERTIEKIRERGIFISYFETNSVTWQNIRLVFKNRQFT